MFHTFSLQRLPKTKPISFESVLKASNETVKAQLTQATQKREIVRLNLEELDGHKLEYITGQIEEYLPYLFSITKIVDSDPAQASNKSLKFSWFSGLELRDAFFSSFNVFTFPSVHFEIVMTLSAYSAALINLSTKLVRSDPIANSKQAVTMLRKAAGIYTFVLNEVIPRLVTAGEVPPLECDARAVRALIGLLTAQAQGMALHSLMAVASGGQKPGLLAKLSAHCFQCFDEAHNEWSDLLVRKKDVKVDVGFLPCATMGRVVYRAITFRLLAEDAYSNDKPGTAFAWAQTAAKQFQEILTAQKKAESRDTEFLKYLEEQIQTIQAAAAKYERENNMVNHERVPDASTLQTPEGKLITGPTLFVLPEPVITSL